MHHPYRVLQEVRRQLQASSQLPVASQSPQQVRQLRCLQLLHVAVARGYDHVVQRIRHQIGVAELPEAVRDADHVLRGEREAFADETNQDAVNHVPVIESVRPGVGGCSVLGPSLKCQCTRLHGIKVTSTIEHACHNKLQLTY